jgi:L,D-peptidoglycan transpeptidase YkuD (ErfK/YbiS/YcfS/YnhG family)
MQPSWRPLAGLLLLLALCCSAGCALHNDLPRRGGESPGQVALPRRIADSLDGVAPLAAPGEQFVYVDPGPASLSEALVYAVQRGASGWELGLAPARANLGRNGVAPPWEKREGDGRTPSGVFPLAEAFGYPGAAPTRLPYRQLDHLDLWVDDPQSPDYNRRVRRGETGAASFEQLLRPDPLYRYALVVGYNEAPAVRDLGSAIFLHLEGGQGAPTSGCISLPEAPLLRLLAWLDPARHPRAVIGTQGGLRALAAGVGPQLPADLPPELARRLGGAARLLALRRGKPGGYFGAAASLPPEVERQMLASGSWRLGCPVAPGELAYLVAAYWGPDGRTHYGELVLHAALSAFVIDSLQSAYNARFPIAGMQLIDAFGADDGRSMAANNSSAFNCRRVPGKPGTFSRHSFGAALDINPRQNPYLQVSPDALRARGWDGTGTAADFLGLPGEPAATASFCRSNPALCLVLPAGSAAYLERENRRPGMLQAGDPLLSAFAQRGFTWGGSWRLPDYQHLDNQHLDNQHLGFADREAGGN